MDGVYEELDCIVNQLQLLSFAVTDDYAEACGRPSGAALQNALYAVAQHLDRIKESLDPVNQK